MGKSKKKTRKELEESVESIEQHLSGLISFVIDYMKFQGNADEFMEHLKERANPVNIETKEAEKKDGEIDKKERYKKVSIPPL